MTKATPIITVMRLLFLAAGATSLFLGGIYLYYHPHPKLIKDEIKEFKYTPTLDEENSLIYSKHNTTLITRSGDFFLNIQSNTPVSLAKFNLTYKSISDNKNSIAVITMPYHTLDTNYICYPLPNDTMEERRCSFFLGSYKHIVSIEGALQYYKSIWDFIW